MCGRFYIAEEDTAEELQHIIDTLNHDATISDLLNPNKRIETLLARHRAAQGEQGQMSMDFNNVNN